MPHFNTVKRFLPLFCVPRHESRTISSDRFPLTSLLSGRELETGTLRPLCQHRGLCKSIFIPVLSLWVQRSHRTRQGPLHKGPLTTSQLQHRDQPPRLARLPLRPNAGCRALKPPRTPPDTDVDHSLSWTGQNNESRGLACLHGLLSALIEKSPCLL